MNELQLKEILSSKQGNIYLVTSRERDIDNFNLRCFLYSKDSFEMRILRGKRCKTKEAVFQEFAAALQFPYYFGHNWDAFDECIKDLAWMKADNFIFFITNLNEVLANNPKDLHIFLEVILKDAVKEWNEYRSGRLPLQNPIPFNIIFHCEPRYEKLCKEILEKENIQPILRFLKQSDNIL